VLLEKARAQLFKNPRLFQPDKIEIDDSEGVLGSFWK